MLALALPAEARIVYTKTNKELPVNKRFLLDLNHDGVVDFDLYYLVYKGWFVEVFQFQRGPNAVWGTNSFASALPSGVRIRSDKRFGVNSDMVVCGYESQVYPCDTVYGQWYKVKNRYLGLRFVIKGQIHYGWARLNVGAKPHPHPILTGYAYETIPNKAIITGKTKMPVWSRYNPRVSAI